MASIDKIFGTLKQYHELHDWLVDHYRELSSGMYDYELVESLSRQRETFAFSSFSTEADKWIYANCPIAWVKEAIHDQYDGDPNLKVTEDEL